MRQQSILLVDRQPYWRDLATAVLRSAGYAVTPSATYAEALPQDYTLVLLGCASVDVDEHLFIARLLACRQQIIVLATYLPAHSLRALFIAGVADAGDKTYDPVEVVAIVGHTLQRLRARQLSQYPREREILHAYARTDSGCGGPGGLAQDSG
jgi:DNA-binding response OmpR family regulator